MIIDRDTKYSERLRKLGEEGAPHAQPLLQARYGMAGTDFTKAASSFFQATGRYRAWLRANYTER